MSELVAEYITTYSRLLAMQSFRGPMEYVLMTDGLICVRKEMYEEYRENKSRWKVHPILYFWRVIASISCRTVPF